ncbi:MAG: molybdenum cofactor biosynthesis protein MoaE [Planctomycetes bacterium]|nr:molybdenum cofactor biosynthesis protein MoaE [Planctomycetota bacterium]
MDKVILTREPLDASLAGMLKRYDAGALATFAGTVRAEDDCNRQLIALDYEAYEEMALSMMRCVRDRAIEKLGVLDVFIAHRLGRVKLGEASIVVGVVSAHRVASFDACRWIVDQVKIDVPIWKKDVWSDGSAEWVNPAWSSE